MVAKATFFASQLAACGRKRRGWNRGQHRPDGGASACHRNLRLGLADEPRYKSGSRRDSSAGRDRSRMVVAQLVDQASENFGVRALDRRALDRLVKVDQMRAMVTLSLISLCRSFPGVSGHP